MATRDAVAPEGEAVTTDCSQAPSSGPAPAAPAVKLHETPLNADSDSPAPSSCCPKCGLGKSSIGVTWELFRNADSLALPQIDLIKVTAAGQA